MFKEHKRQTIQKTVDHHRQNYKGRSNMNYSSWLVEYAITAVNH